MPLNKEIDQILKYTNDFILFLQKNLNERYFITISKIYADEITNEIMVQYKVLCFKMQHDLTVNQFMNSPFIYAVHPREIYLLGIAEKSKKRKDPNSNPAPIQTSYIRTKYLH